MTMAMITTEPILMTIMKFLMTVTIIMKADANGDDFDVGDDIRYIGYDADDGDNKDGGDTNRDNDADGDNHHHHTYDDVA